MNQKRWQYEQAKYQNFLRNHSIQPRDFGVFNMKDKIVEFARLHPEEVALVVAYIDSVDTREK